MPLKALNRNDLRVPSLNDAHLVAPALLLGCRNSYGDKYCHHNYIWSYCFTMSSTATKKWFYLVQINKMKINISSFYY